jgi:hypothetical protein
MRSAAPFPTPDHARARIWAGGADDEAVRITDSAGGFDFQIASKEIARLFA